MPNPVQQARLSRLFDMYNADHDDYLTEQDFTAHVYKLAELRGQAPDAPATIALANSIHDWWSQMAAMADTDHDGKVSRAEVVAFGEALYAMVQSSTDANAPYPLDPWIAALYGVIDGDGDERITVQEYRDWLTAVGLADDTDVEGAFRGFDKNEDGYLSRAEFTEISRQFWTNFDPNIPASRWIGPG